MKLALFVEEKRTQIVITPESEWEKSALSKIPETGAFKLHRGSFYACRGGWTRQGHEFGTAAEDDNSLIFVMDRETE